MSFDFDAVLVGTGTLQDLIVVVDTVTTEEPGMTRSIQGLSRALDIAESKRPLTVVLVGPRPTENVIEALSRVCRVLPVGSASGEDAEENIRDWLAVLLPLMLPNQSDLSADSVAELQEMLSDNSDPVTSKLLLEASYNGKEKVRETFAELLLDAIHGGDDG